MMGSLVLFHFDFVGDCEECSGALSCWHYDGLYPVQPTHLVMMTYLKRWI